MQLERRVSAPPERVWDVITDLDRTADIVGGITHLERLDGGTGFGVGTRWKETRVMFGRSSTETMEVTAVDEGRSYTVESDGHGAHYTAVMSVAPDGDGSRLGMRFDAEATSLGARIASVAGKLFEGSTRKALQADLDDIAAAAERDDAASDGAGA